MSKLIFFIKSFYKIIIKNHSIKSSHDTPSASSESATDRQSSADRPSVVRTTADRSLSDCLKTSVRRCGQGAAGADCFRRIVLLLSGQTADSHSTDCRFWDTDFFCGSSPTADWRRIFLTSPPFAFISHGILKT